MIVSFLTALQTNIFLQTALFCGLLASIASGLTGCFVVIKKIPSITGSISHSVLGGIGLFLWLQYTYNYFFLDPLYGAFITSILAAFLIYWAHLRYRQNESAMIATIWSIGMAIGVIFVSFIKGYRANIESYLFGNILLIAPQHIYFLIVLDIFIILSMIFFYKKFLLICLDEDQAKILGLRVHGLYFFLLSLIALSIVLLIQVMGVILVIALIAIPPTIANLFTSHLGKMMLWSILINFIFILLGTAFSYDLELPPGPTAALLAGITYIFILIIRSIVTKIRVRKNLFH